MSQLNKLREERSRIVTEMRQMYTVAEKESRGLNADENLKWEKMDNDIVDLDKRIADVEKLEGREALLRQSAGTIAQHQADPDKEIRGDNAIDQSATFRSWLRAGMEGMTVEQRQYMRDRAVSGPEFRALSSGTNNTGGFTVAQDFYNQLEIAMKMWGGMMEAGEILRTDNGATLPMPTLNWTSAVATIVGENAASGVDASTPFGSVNMSSYTYRTPVLPVSLEFLQDSSFGESTIINAFGEQLGRGLNAHLTTGTGTGQPQGIITGSTSGKIGTTGQTLTVILDDLIDLEHSVDPAYRANAKFMMHDTSLKIIKKIKDTTGVPIFMHDVTSAAKNTILGYPVQVNQDIAVMAANAKSIAFGRLDKYKIRIVRDMVMLRLTERYADSLQVGFIGFLRADGRLLDAGTNPVKHYQNSAT